MKFGASGLVGGAGAILLPPPPRLGLTAAACVSEPSAQGLSLEIGSQKRVSLGFWAAGRRIRWCAQSVGVTTHTVSIAEREGWGEGGQGGGRAKNGCHRRRRRRIRKRVLGLTPKTLRPVASAANQIVLWPAPAEGAKAAIPGAV